MNKAQLKELVCQAIDARYDDIEKVAMDIFAEPELGFKEQKTSAKVNFHIRYFNYLIMFVIFDLSVIFLYPLFSDGIGYIKSHWGVLISFLVILLCGIFAAINRGFIGSVKK